MINPSSLMSGYEQMGFANPMIAATGMQGMQPIQGVQTQGNFDEMKIINPYAFAQAPASLQGNNALIQQMMGMMPSSAGGFAPQPPYTIVGMPQKT
jgi:hypothetical protein